MTRELFLVVYHEKQKVPAHWSLFVPHKDGDVQGKIIHAVGSPFQGYQLEIKEYDISKTKKRHEKISIGSIHDDWLPHLDSKAQGVTTPGVSKKPLDPFAGENCQNWLQSYVDVLVNDGVIDQGARDVLKDAPKV